MPIIMDAVTFIVVLHSLVTMLWNKFFYLNIYVHCSYAYGHIKLKLRQSCQLAESTHWFGIAHTVMYMATGLSLSLYCDMDLLWLFLVIMPYSKRTAIGTFTLILQLSHQLPSHYTHPLLKRHAYTENCAKGPKSS